MCEYSGVLKRHRHRPGVDARITHGITDGSQLNTFQYRPNTNGAFYVGGASNAYTTTKASLLSRRVLQLVGGDDKLIPAAGGGSGISDGDGGKLQMVPWEDSALAFAIAFAFALGLQSLSLRGLCIRPHV